MLAVRDLAFARGGLRLVEGLSFEVGPGEALVVRGPNGAGKSTLLRVLAGLQPSDGGTIDLAPEEVAYGGHAEGNKPTLSVAENLAFWAEVYGRTVDPAIYETFTLTGLQDRLAGRLSAGQRRRLALARLAVSGRRVLLLDEPTTSLDAASVGLLGEWIDNHLAGGGIAVIVAHGPVPISARELELSEYRAALPKDVGW